MFKDQELVKLAAIVFNTTEGTKLLKHLEEIYYKNSSLDSDIHKTMYNLGQKELISFLISLVHDQKGFRDLVIQPDP